MNLQISSEIVCKANGRDFWLLADKANKDKAKMKKPRPKTQEGSEEKGGRGKGGKEAWPNQPVAVTPESKWPQNTRLRTRTKFLKCFHVPSQLGTQYPSTSLPSLPRGNLLSTVSLCCTAIGNAYNDEQQDPWSFRFALLHSNHFQESTWLRSRYPLLPPFPWRVQLKGVGKTILKIYFH